MYRHSAKNAGLIDTTNNAAIFAEPELTPFMTDIENFAFGFLDGATFLGSEDCISSMEGIVYYAFKVYQYR